MSASLASAWVWSTSFASGAETSKSLRYSLTSKGRTVAEAPALARRRVVRVARNAATPKAARIEHHSPVIFAALMRLTDIPFSFLCPLSNPRPEVPAPGRGAKELVPDFPIGAPEEGVDVAAVGDLDRRGVGGGGAAEGAEVPAAGRRGPVLVPDFPVGAPEEDGDVALVALDRGGIPRGGAAEGDCVPGRGRGGEDLIPD